MADVQLKHGFLRIANSLEEAIIMAPFSGTQMKIVRCLIRLTYGWNETTVRISRPDLAECCGLSAKGGFLRAFDELLRGGVIHEVERPFSRIAGVYELNKDFEHWGPFSVAASRLEALFSKRPQTLARPTLQGQSSNESRPTLEGGSSAVRPTLKGMGDRPSRDMQPHPIGCPSGGLSDDRPEVRPSERQERHRKTVKAERQDRTASLRSVLPAACLAFLDRFYPIAGERRTDVERQLGALAAGEWIRDRRISVFAHGVDRLEAKCADVIQDDSVRDLDKAIVVLFAKLADTSDVSVTRASAEKLEIQNDERLGEQQLRIADEWADANPVEAAQLRTEIEQQYPGDSVFIRTTRRWFFIAEATRRVTNTTPPRTAAGGL